MPASKTRCKLPRCTVCDTPLFSGNTYVRTDKLNCSPFSNGKCNQCLNLTERTRYHSDDIHYKRHLLQLAKSRSYKGDFPCTITIDDIVIPETCPVLGIPLKRNTTKLHRGSPTLDKIVPELGYVPGNVAVISHRANTIKQNATPDELRKVFEWLHSVSNNK